MGISIKEPCNEDWSKMTPTEKGAHCQLCALEVIDFTHKSPFEIKEILFQEFTANKRTCGRITNYQLDALNDDFFHWKNDREAFRAVWLFSLLAVFGLTLFSCQNTLSKEIISKLSIETHNMLETDSSTVDLAVVDSSAANDHPVQMAPPYTGIPFFPFNEITTFTGVMPLTELFVLNMPENWIVCEAFLGDVIVSGSMTIQPDAEDFLSANFLQPIQHPNKLTNNPNRPLVRPVSDLNTPKLEGITTSGDKKFEAFIYPNPIDVSSRLYLSVHENLDLNIMIHEKDELLPLRSGSQAYTPGKHAVDLKLYKLAEGNYQLKLLGLNQLSILDFEVV